MLFSIFNIFSPYANACIVVPKALSTDTIAELEALGAIFTPTNVLFEFDSERFKLPEGVALLGYSANV